ncbi:MAG: FtsQ-type POTRA domain-containing protein [Actinomycetota bacterium]
MVLTAVILLAVGAVMIGATFTPLFEARRIGVSGAGQVTRERILGLAGVEGANVAHLDTTAVERALEADPWIARATVGREVPSTIEVSIAERSPVAGIGDETGRVVAADGTELPGADPTGLPVIDVLTATDVQTAAAVLGAIPESTLEKVERVTADVDGSLALQIRGGIVASYGPAEELVAKGAALAAVLRWLESEGTSSSAIDVSTPTAPTAVLGARSTSRDVTRVSTTGGGQVPGNA